MKSETKPIRSLVYRSILFSLMILLNQVTVLGQSFHGSETMPSYMGGNKALKEFINKNLVFPDSIKKAGISGIVVVRFEIDKEGKVENVKLVRGIHAVCDSEAIRVTRLLGYWQPAIKWGNPIVYDIQLPIEFRAEKIYCSNKPVKVRGTITEKNTGKPVSSALVIAKGTTIGTLSDTTGYYSFEVPGEYLDLEISSLGYTGKTVQIGKNRTINVELDKECLVVNF